MYIILLLLIIISIIILPYVLKSEINKVKYKFELEKGISKKERVKKVIIKEINIGETFRGHQRKDGDRDLGRISYSIQTEMSDEVFHENIDFQLLLSKETDIFSKTGESIIIKEFPNSERCNAIRRTRTNNITLNNKQEEIGKYIINYFLKKGDSLEVSYHDNKVYALINPINVYLYN